jgi:diguanylate cyclase (GGDEF)-like protein
MSFSAQQCFSTPLGAALYLALTRGMTPATNRVWWFGGAVAATLVQAVSVLTYRRSVRLRGHPERWLPAHFAAFAVGLLWGVTPLVMLPRNEADHAVTLAFLACALAGNVVTVGGWRLFASFHLPVSVVPLVVFAARADSGSVLRALGVAVWVVTTVSMYRFVESQQRRAEKLEAQLVGALAAATHEARHDLLTGLPNRKCIIEAIENALASSQPIVLMFIDLDGFKTINDTLGHAVGDAVLCHVASRFLRVVPAGFVLARLGGDEFALVLVDPSDRQIEDMGVALLKSLRDPISLDNRDVVSVGASIGVARSTADATSSDILRRADSAMYEAKKKGRNRVEIAAS